MENSLDGCHVLPPHVTYFDYLEKVEGRVFVAVEAAPGGISRGNENDPSS